MKQEKIANPMGLGKSLKLRRKELGITQRDLARFSNLSHNGISRIEVGDSDIKLSTILKMGKMLGFALLLEFGE